MSCKHKNFKREEIINREDGKVDWKGKCKDCGKPITLKGVYYKTDGDNCLNEIVNEEGVHVETYSFKVEPIERFIIKGGEFNA